MSDDLSAIHAQTSTILEKLYDDKGKPNELDEAFIQEYFQLVKDQLNFDADEVEAGFAGPRQTEAKLSQPTKDLVEVYVSSKKEKFVVSRLQSGK